MANPTPDRRHREPLASIITLAPGTPNLAGVWTGR
jgi:hypothetical protein